MMNISGNGPSSQASVSIAVKKALYLSSALTVVFGLGMIAPATAEAQTQKSGTEDISSATYDFNIAKGPLSEILTKIATRGQVNLVFSDDLSATSTNQPVIGTLNTADALTLALSGTGYSLRILDSGDYVIEKQQAQSGKILLDEIVVTASRAKRNSRSIPASVIVISEDEILQHAQAGGTTSSLVEKFVPGIAPSNQTLSGASQSFRGRGIQVLVDGRVRNTPLRNVSRTMTVVDINQIERIEVVPGARSDYGNGATGGTINFITKAATLGHRVTVKTGVTAFTENVGDSIGPNLSVTMTGTEGKFDYAVTLSAEMTRDAYTGDGDLAPSDPLIGQGGLDNTKKYDASLKGGFNINENQRLQASFNIVELNQDPEYATDYTTDPVSADTSTPYAGESVRERSKYAALDYSHSDTPIGEIELSLYADDIKKRFAFSQMSAANPAVLAVPATITQSPYGQSETATQRVGFRFTVDSSLDTIAKDLKFTWGGDLNYDETEQYFVNGLDRIAPMSQFGSAVFGQISVPVSIFEFTGGMRYERFDLDIDDFTRPDYAYMVAPGVTVPIAAANVTGGSHIYDELVFNAGVVAHLTEPVDAFVNYSEGFSIPDVGGFTSRAGVTTPLDYSTFQPKANVVRSLETGLRYRSKMVRADLSTYISKSDYGTNFDLATNSLTQQKEEIWGIELNGDVDVNDWLSIGGVASYTKGKYDSDQDGTLDADLPANRLPTEFKTSLYTDMHLFDDLNLRLTGNYAGGRKGDAGGSSGDFDIDQSFTVDVAARYTILDADLAVGVFNLLDSGAENLTATAVRGFPVTEYGRRIAINYTKEF